MANTYTQDLVVSQFGTTSQVKLMRMDPSLQLATSNVITVVTQNSVACCIEVIAFTNLTSGAPASTATGAWTSGTQSSVQTSAALTTAATGDLIWASGSADSSSETLSSLKDNTAGNTMTTIHAAQTGQSRFTASAYETAPSAATFQPIMAVGTLAHIDILAARYAKSGGTPAVIASSYASPGWAADPGTKTFTVSPGATIPTTAGTKLFVVVTSNGNAGTLTVTDDAVGAPVNTVAPVISGTQRAGATLTTTNGTWTGDISGGATYQWQRGGVNIASATASTYVLTNADFGATTAITCIVTETGTGGSTAATSNTLTGVAAGVTEPAQDLILQLCANEMMTETVTFPIAPTFGGALAEQLDWPSILVAHVLDI